MTDSAVHIPLGPRFRMWFMVLGSLAAVGCGYLPPVIGPEDVLVILASNEDRPLLEPLFNDVFGRTMDTPAPEPYFKLRWASPLDFDKFRRYKSLVIASLSNPADSTGDLLIRSILGEERVAEAMSGGNPVFVASDFLARGQMFMGLTALDAIHAQGELTRLKGWIFDRFEQQLRVRQTKSMYRHGDNKKLGMELEEKYGWWMRLQEDYLLMAELPEQNFVLLGRAYPYRWLGIHWVESADTVSIGPEWSWRHVEFMAADLFGTIYLDSLFRSTELATANGHTVFVLRGVWGHREELAGGPFFTYIFRDRTQDRVYFVTGIVFNPGGSKTMLLRQQEVIVRTFHTFKEPPVRRAANGADKLT